MYLTNESFVLFQMITSQSQSHSQPNSNSNSSSSSSSTAHSVGLQHSSESTLKAQLNSNALTAALSNSSSTSSISAPSSNSTSDDNVSSPPVKRIKCDPKDMKDVCVGTSVGTITEPDHLGPCEPGTSVTLEGIVWHETEGGVLAVNVTWRGKTYLGTLIDCTKHDWAPPRFCDSPTEELDSRTPKGRGKRGRIANTPTNDLSNFTETRSSVHSKLRNGGAKGRGGRNISTGLNPSTSSSSNSTTSVVGGSNAGSTPSTSPTEFLVPRPEKRKSKDESPQPTNGSSNSTNNNTGSTPNGSTLTQNVTNPVTGTSVQISVKKVKTLTTPCAISPVLLECPEQDCSKKYKHANGLKYHQSHAHGSISSIDDDSSQAPESPQRLVRPNSPTVAVTSTPSNVSPMPISPIVLNTVPIPGNCSKESLPVIAPLTPKTLGILTGNQDLNTTTPQTTSLIGTLTVNPLTQTSVGNNSLTATNPLHNSESLQQGLGNSITTTPVRTDSQAKGIHFNNF